MTTSRHLVPPQALDAERSVLGSILIDPESIIKISDLLNPDDFYSEANGNIYKAMTDLFTKQKPIDIITLVDALEETKLLDIVGGAATLGELATEVPSASHIFEYAQIVKKKSTLRKIIRAGDAVKGLGYIEEKTVEELLEEAEKEIFTISQNFLRDRFIHIKEILSSRFELFAELHESDDPQKIRGIPTGFRGLDKILGGFQSSDLIVLAGRPSMGKTALALTFVLHAGLRQKKTIGVFSLEMSKEQLVDRMLASQMAVDSWKLQRGKLEDEDFQRMGQVMSDLNSASIFIDDSVGSSISELRAKARRLQMEHGLDMIVIDYLQLMTSGQVSLMGNRVQEISEISRSLKSLSRELHLPIIALSQLSRNVEARNDKRPILSDLRDSGAIEQDADVVLMIYRDDYYNEDSDYPGITEVWIRKHRNGPTGHTDLRFDKTQMRFYEIEKAYGE
ncbi:replicative DNA helicase [Candidatus Peregrinibacteria bacterium]|nr:replicative DNA helicase [Candidatus Peregrinibacteria bacterium]